jgi:iron complex outermembrane receptor protein
MITTLTHPIRALRCALSVLLLGLAVKLYAAPVAFDIPAQPAAEALDLFIKQSGANIVYLQADVQGVSTNAVKGTHEPAVAMDLLLKNTVLVFTESKPNEFAVGLTKPGSVEGSVQSESGRPVAGAHVSLTGTKQMTVTDKRGRFALEDMPAGTYALAITGEGIQNTKVTDVNVKAGHRLTLSAITVPVAVAGAVQLEDYVVSAKKNEGIVELDPFSVEGRREKPFTTANVDIPRTINDVQPYTIFDSKVIEQSGVLNAEDFLKQRLTMNASFLSSGQVIGSGSGVNGLGVSSIDLRGLGQDKTLVLVNGRRMAGVRIGPGNTTDFQADLNGIPLSSIERIEILPTSSSAIYGGSSLGGVVNVVLKKEYSGGEIRLNYRNTFDSDAPARTVSANFGCTLEDGKTHLLLSATWADSQPLLLRDRPEITARGLGVVWKNSPAFFENGIFLGSISNIQSTAGTNLVLKDGRSLGSPTTHVAPGTSPTDSAAAVAAGLLANAGTWDMHIPLNTQVLGSANHGLLTPLGQSPQSRSLRASLRRKFGNTTEVLFDYSYNRNRSTSVFTTPTPSFFTFAANSPVNPFNGAVTVAVPLYGGDLPQAADSTSTACTLGVLTNLPGGWTGIFDYTYSRSAMKVSNYILANAALTADIAAGVINPFVDTSMYPLDMAKYYTPQLVQSTSILDNFTAKASGPFKSLPWGAPSLTVGSEYRIQSLPSAINDRFSQTDSTFPLDHTLQVSFPRKQYVASVYSEMDVPLLRDDWLPLVHSASLQIAGRLDHHTVGAGTVSYTRNVDTGVVAPLAGAVRIDANTPYFTKDTYSSNNYTIGLKYEPTKEIIFRASVASAFTPPTPNQLIKNPAVSSTLTRLQDPKNGNATVQVQTISGGNPDLSPQDSRSVNLGAIWQPRSKILSGLRLNLEYYWIQQFNVIASLSAQSIVNSESTYPDRVTRNTAGQITLVDTSSLNLFSRSTEGWDLGLDYSIKTAAGRFSLNATGTMIVHLKQKNAATTPNQEYLGFLNFNGANLTDGRGIKYRANSTVSWERQGWNAGWTVRYFGAYSVTGSAGDPSITHSVFVDALGGRTRIPSQTYHDLFFGYQVEEKRGKSGWQGDGLIDGLTIQLGVSNVFNLVPPTDPQFSTTYYLSPFADLRLRQYSLTVTKKF